jgi:hypothetical protein
MAKKPSFLVIGLVALLLSSCAVGSRRVVTEEKKVSNFNEVDFATLGELTITQGDHESLTIEAESNIMRRIRTTVRDGTLYIEMRSSFPWVGGVVPTKPIRYDLTVKELTALDLSGLGSIYAGSITADHLSLNLSGGGKVKIQALVADSLEVDLSGLGECELSGKVGRQEVILSGGGEYDAADLVSQRAEVHMSGLGNATVWATEALDIELSGGGQVEYYGNPSVTQDVSGLGKIKGLGGK